MAFLTVQHRVNDEDGWRSLQAHRGAEIDLRSHNGKIVLHHDPFCSGADFENFLTLYTKASREAPLILNPKEDGLERLAIDLCNNYAIESFFFLDLTIPSLVKLARIGFRKMAIRVSEYEPLEMARNFKGMAEWVWLDCFSGRAPTPELITSIQAEGFRVCLVSPELQGFDEFTLQSHLAIRSALRPNDAVCTKVPAIWEAP